MHLTKLENWLAYTNQNYLASDEQPSTSDFHLWEMIDQIKGVYNLWETTKTKNVLEDKPKL